MIYWIDAQLPPRGKEAGSTSSVWGKLRFSGCKFSAIENLPI